MDLGDEVMMNYLIIDPRCDASEEILGLSMLIRRT